MSTNQEKLAVLAFFDSRPGHAKQTRGILHALALLTPVSVTEVKIEEAGYGGGLGAAWRTLVSALGGRPKLAPGAAGIPEGMMPDLIIGTGSHTHVPMLQARNSLGGKVVTCMTPNPGLLSRMDLCFVPRHDRCPDRKNVVRTMGPPNTAEPGGVHAEDLGLILVGGTDEKSHVWESDKTLSHIRALTGVLKDVHWAVSSSPRTPPDMNDLLSALEGERENVTFFKAGDTPQGWIEKQYGQAGQAWVTADSVSMVFEALSAGCRVGILPVRWKRSDNKIARAMEGLVEAGLVGTYEQWIKKPGPLPEPSGLNEAARCAEEILRRFFPERMGEG
ncbi:MAG: mitochondrial fission ELM1 family protein [Thermodesulfobacteriota bacterium]